MEKELQEKIKEYCTDVFLAEFPLDNKPEYINYELFEKIQITKFINSVNHWLEFDYRNNRNNINEWRLKNWISDDLIAYHAQSLSVCSDRAYDLYENYDENTIPIKIAQLYINVKRQNPLYKFEL